METFLQDHFISTKSPLMHMVEEHRDFVVPSTLTGLYGRLFENGNSTEIQILSDAECARSLSVEEQRSQGSYEIIASLTRSCESFKSLNAPRSATYCRHRMAVEYINAGDLINARQLFDGVAGMYRQEGWIALLWECLGYLRECSRMLGSVVDFIQYSLEMAALPVFSFSGVEAPDSKWVYGPAGPLSLSQRETIQQEVFSLLKGHATERSSELFVEDDHPKSVDVDLVSPLRMAFRTSVAFHSQTMKSGSSALFTVSILSQLPHPVEIDQLEVIFNQISCNFKVVNDNELIIKRVKTDSDDNNRLESISSLILTTNKWFRRTLEISSGQSGKLECMSVNVMVGKQFTFCCRPESPVSLEDLPLWKFEDLMETVPTRDHMISFSGQKYIQVAEPGPQVELNLSASGPALVGESFIVSVSVVSKAHAVYSGELKINLVDARGGGMLISPRESESFSLDSHHVELLSVSRVFDDGFQSNSDDIRRIQQSFGVVSVPFLGVGQLWSCRLEIKWNRPKSVMLYVSLGYMHTEANNAERVNVHRSLQIEGKIPFVISHRFMMPFRREPLVLSKLKALPIVDQKIISLPLNETSILIVRARNCCDIPLCIASLSIEPDGSSSCSVHRSVINPLTPPSLIVPGEEFKQVFAVTPHAKSPDIGIGTVLLEWARDTGLGQHNNFVLARQKVMGVSAEATPLVVSIDCPPHAVLGLPFLLSIKVRNNTALFQEVKCSVGDCQSFVFTGPNTDSVFILPKSEHVIGFKLLPLLSGSQHIPVVTVTSVRYSASMNPSLAATAVFVYPSEPTFEAGQNCLFVQASE